MDESEKKIEEYIASNSMTREQEKPSKQDAESQVEDKAREGGPLSASILQKRSKLEPAKLENRIGQISAKHVGRIDETTLREHVAKHLEANNEEISEADLIRIQDQLLKKQEQEQLDQPGIAPPPFLNDSLTAAGNRARVATDWMASLKTPGGVGFLVFVLIFFVWVIVPVNDANQTRLQLLWGILTGQTGFSQSIKDQETQLATQAAADSGVGYLFPNFGGGSVKPVERQMIPVEMPFVPSFEE